MRVISLFFGAVLAAVFLASPAIAGKNDDAWAKCLWEQAPKSASNWLAMMPTSKADPTYDKSELLSFRLQGFCFEKMTPPGEKYAVSFKKKAVRSALLKLKPSEIGVDIGESKAFRCMFFEGDIPLGTSMGFGNISDMKPRSPVTSIRCKTVNAEGILVDAVVTELH